MTMKDYQLIADVFRFNTTHCPNEHGVDCVVFDALVRELCIALKRANPNFNTDKFKSAVTR